MKHLNKIKSSLFQRSLALTKITISTGSKAVGYGLGQFFASESVKDQKWAAFLSSQAQSLSLELGKLKGSVMKAGQMLSMYGELFLPPEANQFLKTLQAQSPPLQFSEIKKLLLTELGSEKLSLLEVEPVPLGSASLGQVHQAKIKSSSEVLALKVQYPGMSQAISSDLRALRKFMSMLSLLPGDFQTDILFQEVQAMLEQEVQYDLEAQNTEKYGALLIKDRRFIVPKLHPEFCTPKILATSYEIGLAPDDPMISALSQERRNRLALNFLELYFIELFVSGAMQTDPHLGNYKIRLSPDGQDQWVLLDFGAVKIYDPLFLNAYHRMVKAALMGDQAALERASLDLKFIQGADSLELKKIFQEFCNLTVEPFADSPYDWSQSDLPQRLTAKAMKIIRGFPLRTPPREVIFLDRKTSGVFIMLKVLGARLQARDLLLRFLEPIQLNVQL